MEQAFYRPHRTWLVAENRASDVVGALLKVAAGQLSAGVANTGAAIEAAFGIVNGHSVKQTPDEIVQIIEDAEAAINRPTAAQWGPTLAELHDFLEAQHVNAKAEDRAVLAKWIELLAGSAPADPRPTLTTEEHAELCAFLEEEEGQEPATLRKWAIGEIPWDSIRKLVPGKSDPRPLLTPESVDAIPGSVCEAVWVGVWPTRDTVDPLEKVRVGRRYIRAVAENLPVPITQPSSDSGQLDTAEADRLLNEAKASLSVCGSNRHRTAIEAIDKVLGRLTLKPRRLTDEEALELSEFADSRVPAEAVAGHSIARELARLWGLEVPEERPCPCREEQICRNCDKPMHFGWTCHACRTSRFRVSASEAADERSDAPRPKPAPEERPDAACRKAEAGIMAEEIRSLRAKIVPEERVEAMPSSKYAQTHYGLLAFLRDHAPARPEWRGLVAAGAFPAERPSHPAPVASVELSEAERNDFSFTFKAAEAWSQEHGHSGTIMIANAKTAINRILAARKTAPDAAPLSGMIGPDSPASYWINPPSAAPKPTQEGGAA